MQSLRGGTQKDTFYVILRVHSPEESLLFIQITYFATTPYEPFALIVTTYWYTGLLTECLWRL